ncbi:arsenosugar biosynthesis radical SAM (seleno)protein ArsS [Synechococcus sp. PCC 7336]|uniref:arsenosugar biosynthesis radical SAM (seleno)protein ArsS n=1 Tax=Synechococcus sp. PCC 7336 TaxID=195250 RepID=UPI0003464FE5|nr:arsenosugar biosynthesis radical SAM (seleno)protein ArsS [Synechococcus sp. PCC 7336]
MEDIVSTPAWASVDPAAIDLDSSEAGPKRILSLLRRRSPLASPQHQLAVLQELEIAENSQSSDFKTALANSDWARLSPGTLEIFQINIGKLCNMACRHCHVDAGPDRTRENMDRATIDACLAALDRTQAHTVDITGGAPELNPHFRYLVDQCVARGKHVIDRCNLTVLLLPGRQDLPAWLADRGVEVACSLPHYRQRNTDAQRGDGTYEQSIEALKRLNAAGYGQGNPKRRLTLVTNPVGAFLSRDRERAEQEWKQGLERNHGVTFDRLIAINNMPISRYLEWLQESDNLQSYMELLVNAFNPGAIEGLMCRNTLSIGWDGRIYDCDFNQMLDLELALPDKQRPTIHNFDPELLAQRTIVTDRHCFGCTAGAGSSCGGATEK